MSADKHLEGKSSYNKQDDLEKEADRHEPFELRQKSNNDNKRATRTTWIGGLNMAASSIKVTEEEELLFNRQPWQDDLFNPLSPSLVAINRTITERLKTEARDKSLQSTAIPKNYSTQVKKTFQKLPATGDAIQNAVNLSLAKLSIEVSLEDHIHSISSNTHPKVLGCLPNFKVKQVPTNLPKGQNNSEKSNLPKLVLPQIEDSEDPGQYLNYQITHRPRKLIKPTVKLNVSHVMQMQKQRQISEKMANLLNLSIMKRPLTEKIALTKPIEPITIIDHPPKGKLNSFTESIGSACQDIGKWFNKLFSFKKTDNKPKLINLERIGQRKFVRKLNEVARVETKNEYPRKNSNLTDWLQRSSRAIILASGLITASGGVLTDLKVGFNKQALSTTKASAINSANPLSVATAATAPMKEVSPIIDSDDKSISAKNKSEQQSAIAKLLAMSKSPVVQAILQDGTLKLGNMGIIDAMISPFKGLANAEQAKQIAALEAEINLALTVFFNEHFGDDAAIAKTKKEHPTLMVLLSTAKHAQKMGWLNSNLTTKKLNPNSYALARQIFSDSWELGLDTTEKDLTKAHGNLFQAKKAGDTLNLFRKNGQYHVAIEAMLGIFNGKKSSDLVKSLIDQITREKIKAEDDKKEASADAEKLRKVNLGKNADTLPTSKDTILPNIAPKAAFSWMGIYTEQENAEEKASIDEGWDKLLKEANFRDVQRENLEKSGMIEFDLPLHLTTRQENDLLIENVVKQLMKIYPQANAENIAQLVKRYGYAGLNKVKRSRGHFTVTLNANFQRILEIELKKSGKF